MKALLALFVFIGATVASAEISKIEGLDAQNVCAAFRSMYALQTTQLSTFPLAQVIQLRAEKNGLFSFIIGNDSESVSCTTKNLQNTLTNNQSDVLKVIFNPEVSSFETDRTIGGWTYYKAFNLQGALAGVVCAQLEMLNVVEDQAEIRVDEQVLTTFTSSEAVNVFGLIPTVSAENAFNCGAIDTVKTFLIPSVEGW